MLIADVDEDTHLDVLATNYTGDSLLHFSIQPPGTTPRPPDRVVRKAGLMSPRHPAPGRSWGLYSETLICAALLTLVLSRRLHPTLARRWRVDRLHSPLDRWSRLTASVAQDLLAIVLSPVTTRPKTPTAPRRATAPG